MNDRELLEMAARAAGLKITWNPLINSLSSPIVKYVNAYEYTEWNPLIDDGDALRLAVKLGLSVIQGTYNVGCQFISQEEDSSIVVLVEQFWNDQYAATRRAIVRAAAEIGRAM